MSFKFNAGPLRNVERMQESADELISLSSTAPSTDVPGPSFGCWSSSTQFSSMPYVQLTGISRKFNGCDHGARERGQSDEEGMLQQEKAHTSTLPFSPSYDVYEDEDVVERNQNFCNVMSPYCENKEEGYLPSSLWLHCLRRLFVGADKCPEEANRNQMPLTGSGDTQTSSPFYQGSCYWRGSTMRGVTGPPCESGANDQSDVVKDSNKPHHHHQQQQQQVGEEEARVQERCHYRAQSLVHASSSMEMGEVGSVQCSVGINDETITESREWWNEDIEGIFRSSTSEGYETQVNFDDDNVMETPSAMLRNNLQLQTRLAQVSVHRLLYDVLQQDEKRGKEIASMRQRRPHGEEAVLKPSGENRDGYREAQKKKHLLQNTSSTTECRSHPFSGDVQNNRKCCWSWLSSQQGMNTTPRESMGCIATRKSSGDFIRYINDIRQLLFVPSVIDQEENEVRQWIRSVNHLRKHGTLWDEMNAIEQQQPQPEKMPETVLMQNDGENPTAHSLHVGPGSSSVYEREDSVRSCASTSATSLGNCSSASRLGVASGATGISGDNCINSYDDSGTSVRRLEAHGQFCNEGGGGTVSTQSYASELSSGIRFNHKNNSDVLNRDNNSQIKTKLEVSCTSAQCMAGETCDNDLKASFVEFNARNKQLSRERLCSRAMGNPSTKRGGERGYDAQKASGVIGKRAACIASLKAHLVLMEAFIPLPFFIGLALLISSIAISGLFAIVLMILLSVVVYRHVVLLYPLCFSGNVWPSSVWGPSGSGSKGSNSAAALHDGWLLLPPTLLDLVRRIGGRCLLLIVVLLYIGAFLTAAILFLFAGFILTGGAVASIQDLWDRSMFDTIGGTDTSLGCRVEMHFRYTALLPFLAIAVSLAGSAKVCRGFCWWETGVFRLISVVVLAMVFITALVVQVLWALQRSPNKFGIPFRFITMQAWDRAVPGFQWLHDPLSYLQVWGNFPAMGYPILRLSMSVSQLSWLLIVGVSAIKAGTHHPHLAPLLWQPRSSNTTRTKISMRQQQEKLQEGKKHPVVTNAHRSVFSASGFGFPFRVMFVSFVFFTLVATFIAFLGTRMEVSSPATPLPLRLLWTVVPRKPTNPLLDTYEERNVACSLGFLEYSHVGMLRFFAILIFLTGLIFLAWVPYFIVNVSRLVVNLRPSLDSVERQAVAASAFLRSKRAEARRRTEEHSSCAPSVIPAADKGVWLSPLSPATRLQRLYHWWRSGKLRSPALSGTLAVVFDASSPFMAHPEKYHATTRGGDGVRVAKFFKLLRLITLEKSWLNHHVGEVFLLRLPLLLFVFVFTALLAAGRSVHCYGFWRFDVPKEQSTSSVQDLGQLGKFHHCEPTLMVSVGDQLYSRWVLFATIGGGFFVAPLVFALPAVLLLRSWWEERRSFRINAPLARIVRDEEQRRGSCDATALLGASHRTCHDGEMYVPLLAATSDRTTTLTLSEVCGGLAGVQFFLAQQRSEGVGKAILSEGAPSSLLSAMGKQLTTWQVGRHRVPTYNAPLPPSIYYHYLHRQETMAAKGVPMVSFSSSSIETTFSLLQSVLRVMVEFFSLLAALLAWAGAWHALVALKHQYKF